MNSMNRAGIHKTGMQMLDNTIVSESLLFKIIHKLVALYSALLDFLRWAKMMRSGEKPLNELTLEGLYTKEVEVFYFDFFDYKDWEKAKDSLRCLMTSVVLSAVFYLMATYLMDLDLRIRVFSTCIVSTLLTLLLSYSTASRAITFLLIPSMARSSLRNGLLIGAVILLASGPAYNLRSNMDAISSSKACLHEQYFDIVSLVKSLHGKNVIALIMIPVRLILSAIQLVAELLYRMVHVIYMAFEKLIETMKKLFKKLLRMLKKLMPRINFKGSCLKLIRRISKKFRRTRLLGGFVQLIFGIVNLFRSVDGHPPLAKPTIGYFVHRIGADKVCPLLIRAKEMFEEKKHKLQQWFGQHVMKWVNEIAAVGKLIGDAIGPNTRVEVTTKGGVKHQLREIKAAMKAAVAMKSAEAKDAVRFASQLVQIICTVISLLVFAFTVWTAISFYRSYMTLDEFENNYVTAPFLRLEELEPPVLPLDAYEKSRVSILADAMIGDIIKRLAASDLIFAILRLVPFIIVIMLEWIFYAMALFMETTWDKAISIERNIDTRLSFKTAKQAAETNPMALLLSIIIQVQRALREINLDINVFACSPKSSKPNLGVDITIGALLIIYTVFTLFGPFFLKLRHHIMLELEPVRAVQRAVWLRRQIEADRELMPSKRDLFGLAQLERDNSSLRFLFKIYIVDRFEDLMTSLRSLFNLPTVSCARCGIRGSLTLKNFNDFFTVCDSCESTVCAQCAHCVDESGAIRLRESCPSCGLKMEDVEIDAEDMEDEDPLNDMLFNFLDLMPGYKVSRSALAAHAEEIRAHKEAKAKETERSFMTVLGDGANFDPEGGNDPKAENDPKGAGSDPKGENDPQKRNSDKPPKK